MDAYYSKGKVEERKRRLVERREKLRRLLGEEKEAMEVCLILSRINMMCTKHPLSNYSVTYSRIALFPVPGNEAMLHTNERRMFVSTCIQMSTQYCWASLIPRPFPLPV